MLKLVNLSTKPSTQSSSREKRLANEWLAWLVGGASGRRRGSATEASTQSPASGGGGGGGSRTSTEAPNRRGLHWWGTVTTLCGW